MITIEQYNKAVQIINEFHEQISKSIEDGKTTISEFLVANKDLDTRTRHALIRIDGYHKRKHQHVMYIEDLDRTTFLKTINAGKKSWENFIKARGY